MNGVTTDTKESDASALSPAVAFQLSVDFCAKVHFLKFSIVSVLIVCRCSVTSNGII
jgi:hypothetical protein